MADTPAVPDGLTLAPAPHLGVPLSSARMAWGVSLALVPAAAWGIFLFGLSALEVLGASILAALVTEALSALLFRRFTLHDGSAFLHRAPRRALDAARGAAVRACRRRRLSAFSSSSRRSVAWGRTG